MISLADRVAVVTGAGRGIGRAHARELARLGAKVVVNDRGGAGDGSGSDSGPANEVVKEIVDAGGEATANGDDISTWAGASALVDQCVSDFGRLDVVVNNAGILRDGFIAGLREPDWDAVINVHLKGHFAVLHHAAAYWKSRSKAGDDIAASVINTTSASGTFMPNPGQANYGAAKAGIAAITQVAAMELERYGVRVNAIAPVARTRLTLATPGMGALFAEEVPEGEFDAFAPENISPIVAVLAARACTINGQVLAVQGGAVSRLNGWCIEDTIECEGPWDLETLPDSMARFGKQ